MNFSRHRLIFVILTTVTAITLTACNPPPSATPTPVAPPILPTVGDVEAGRALFAQGTRDIQPCSACHSLDGSKLLGPSLQGIATAAGTRVAGQDAEIYLLLSMTNPGDHLTPGYAAGLMPAVQATPQQYRDLLTYLLTLR